MRKILVTGAAGFIGNNLVGYLIKDNQSLESIRLLIAPWDRPDHLDKRITDVVICDIRNDEEVKKVMKNVGIVYHLASKTGYDGGDYSYFKDTNVNGTKNLIEEALREKIKKFIFFSSSGVYGLPATAGSIRNVSEKNKRKPSEGYGRSKFEAENLLMGAKNLGLNYIIIRPTTVYGPRDRGGLTQLIRTINSGLFLFIGNAKNRMDYIYVEDLVRVARTLEKSKINNEDFIVGSGNSITLRELVETICKNLHRDLPKIYIPKFLALILSYPAKYFFKLLGKKPIFFPNRVRVITSDYFFNIDKIKKAINYKPKFSFNDGVHETIAWLRGRRLL